MSKTRVSIVSFLNSKPFLWGIEKSGLNKELEIDLDIPSKIVSKLSYKLVDIGLIPVAGLADLECYKIVSDYCIGAQGNVKTVVIMSDAPLQEVDTILMDYQSRTSVLLAKVLAKFYWKREYKWENTCSKFQHTSISGKTAGVLIGDRVFEVGGKYKYCYDLSEEWNKFTGLPFVFAVWATNKEIAESFERDFNRALKIGVDEIEKVVLQEQSNYPNVDIADYFANNISFDLNDAKREGMKKFLQLAAKLEAVEI